MNNSKAAWTCSYCSRIFKNPIQLPCDDNICGHHLTEANVIRDNQIKCPKCYKLVILNRNEFMPNKLVQQLLDKEIFLSDEEKRLKHKLEEGTKTLHQCWDEFSLGKSKHDLECSKYFNEMKRQINLQREKLKNEIDKIATEMIEKTSKYERAYLESMNAKSEKPTKSFKDEMKDLNEMFRNPNILLSDLKQMQENQEKILADLRFKLTEMSQVKKHLKTNEFEPSPSIKTNIFGKLNLNEYSSNKLYQSQILTVEQAIELIKLCKFSSRDKWRLLYRGSRDGFGASDFHSKCDNHANTLTLIRAKQTGYIFGGFTSVAWASTNQFKSDPNAFVFSLTNKDNTPCKMNVAKEKVCDLLLVQIWANIWWPYRARSA